METNNMQPEETPSLFHKLKGYLAIIAGILMIFPMLGIIPEGLVEILKTILIYSSALLGVALIFYGFKDSGLFDKFKNWIHRVTEK